MPGFEPKWPNVAGELSEPVQCGDFASRSSKPRPQSFGVWRPKPGSTPSRPGNWTEVASASVSGAISVGASSSCPKRSTSASVPESPAAASPSKVAPRASGTSTASRRYVAERHLGARFDVRGERDEPGVGVDPPLARPAERGRHVPREPGRVREQMADRRARRPGRLVEVDRPLLRGDERGVGDEGLRHRAPAEAVVRVAVLRDDRRRPSRRPPPRAPPATTRSGGAPPRRAILAPWRPGPWSAASSGGTRPTSRSRASRGRSSPGGRSTSPARRRFRGTAIRRRARTSRCGSASSSSARRSSRRERRSPTSSARGCSSSTRPTGRRSPAPTARCSPRSGPPRRRSSPRLLDPRWRVEIEAEAVLSA